MGKYKSKKENEPEEKVSLTNVQRLMDVINNRRDAGIKEPRGLSESAQESAKWWIKLLEPRLKFEVVDKNIDPYQERLVDSLKTYYKFSHSGQAYILSLFDRDIMWRGDSIEFMKIREKVDMSKIDKTKLFSMMKTIIARA